MGFGLIIQSVSARRSLIIFRYLNNCMCELWRRELHALFWHSHFKRNALPILPKSSVFCRIRALSSADRSHKDIAVFDPVAKRRLRYKLSGLYSIRYGHLGLPNPDIGPILYQEYLHLYENWGVLPTLRLWSVEQLAEDHPEHSSYSRSPGLGKTRFQA